jgi:hypothetical protein
MPADDTLYGLVVPSSSTPGQFNIRKYNAGTGAFLGEFTINDLVASSSPNGPQGMQLLTAGNMLALLTEPTPDLYRLDLPDAYRLFLIDRTSGNVTYSGAFSSTALLPEPAAGIMVITMLAIIIASRRSSFAADAGRPLRTP